MNEAVTVIDIVAQVTDETDRGVRSATDNVSKLEQTMMNLQKQIQGMKGKSKLEVVATLKDMASKGIQGVAAEGKKIAGKVWTVTLKSVDLVTAPFKKVWGMISNPITQAAAFAGISVGIADTMNTFKDFESAMASVAATAGIDKTSETFAALEKAAREAGATTTKSATEAANALEYMSLAGWDAQTSIEALPKVLQLSEATGMELGRTSDLVTDSMAALGLTVDGLPTYLDKVAKAQIASNQSAEQLMEAYLGVGGLFKDLGIDITESATALGVLANRGTKGTEAATALNAILLNLTTGTGEAGKMMESLGLSAFDNKGNFIGLQNVLEKVNDVTADMTQEEKNATLAAIGGKEHVASLNKLLAGLNETNAEGVSEWDALAASIEDSSGALEDMARRKNDTLAGSLSALGSAADEAKIAIGKKLEPYVRKFVDWITVHMPDIQKAVGTAVDFVTGKIDSVLESIRSLTASREWRSAETIGDKIKLAWDKLIAEPFDIWWNGTGKTWLAEKASGIGEWLGTALKTGILSLFGMDISGAATDGVSIGKSFFDGFMNGFDWEKVSKKLGEALKDGLKFLFKDAATLLPGGKEASGTSALSAVALGYGAFKIGKTGSKLYKGGKALVNGTKAIGSAIGNVTGITEGINIFKAAKGGGSAAQSVLAMAQNGALGRGMQFGAKIAGGASNAGKFLSKMTAPLVGGASKVGKFLSKSAGSSLAGVASAIQMGADAYHGVQKAEEWTGSNSTGNKIASGIGAAIGGLGDGILGNESTGRKVSNITGGALKGAGIGAAIGSIVPGVGTVIGGTVGAGVGTIGAAIGGSNIAKGLSAAGDAIKGFFTETIPQKWDELVTGIGNFFTETIPYAIGYAAGKVQIFFTETIPNKFDELVTQIGNFFTETIPYAIGYVAGKVQIFFTKTIPNKFDELVTGIGNFFTETMPRAMETVGEALTKFFTETVPDFFGELWDGIVGFFTESIPNTIESIGKSISGFFSTIGEKVSGFFGGIWDKVTGSTSVGYTAATEKHAEGGIMTRPHMGLVAEDGAEAIIPLSGKRRERGIDLWEKTGRILGVKPYSKGGIVGISDTKSNINDRSNTALSPHSEWNTNTTGSGMSVPVTIQNLTFEINVNGGSQDLQAIVEIIKENIRGMTDEIAYQLATAIQQVFANTPKTSWEG